LTVYFKSDIFFHLACSLSDLHTKSYKPKYPIKVIRYPQAMTYRKIFPILAIFTISFFLHTASLSAYWLWSSESGKFVSSDTVNQEESEELLKHALSFRHEKNGERSIAELENLLQKFPSSHIAPEAQFQIGLIHEEAGDYSRAFGAYKKLTENYPQSEKSDEVIERVFKIGQMFLSGYKEKVAGVVNVSRLPKAVEVFEHIVKIAPFGKYGDQAQFHIGVAYKTMGRFREAVEEFQKFVDRYPSSVLLDDAYFQLAESSYAFSKKATRDQYAVEDAITNISNYLAKYPSSNASEKVMQLKKEIEEQDAEKNFRIGLYYEEQNELESARLYFEGVSKKYPETAAGKQSAEKLKFLGTSIEAIRKNQQMLDEKMEEVEAKLKGLDYEREALKTKIKEQGNLTAESDELKQLEAARLQLELKKSDMQNNLERRVSSLKTREAAWRIKRKNFDDKRKDLKDNPAPELLTAFERWEESLKQEKTELDKEHQALIGFQSELGEKPSRFAFRVPFFSKRQLPLQEVLNFRQKDLEKIRSEKDAVGRKLINLERQLNQMGAEAGASDQKDFSENQKSAAFQETLGAERADLKSKQADLTSRQEQLKALIDEFAAKKSAYQKEFGGHFTENLTLDLSVVEGSAGLDLAISQSSKEAISQQLQQDKAQLADALVEQKRLVLTLSSAFDTEVNKGKLALQEKEQPQKKDQPPSQDAQSDKYSWSKLSYRLTPEELALDQRDLRKRVKFVEREMRKHFDEIEDWNQKKQAMLSELDRLMNGERRESVTAKAIKPVTAPARFMFWLMRSLAFGLSSDDKQLVRQAKRRTNSGELSPENEKVRSLHQEIELQTILIQSRHEEIVRMSDQVKALELRLESVRRDDQVLRHVFLEKESALADESLRSADQIVAEEDRLPILIGKIDIETKRLQELERKLNEVDEKLLQISRAPNRAVSGAASDNSAETGESKSADESADERKKAEDELNFLKQKIETEAKLFQENKKTLDQELYEFYKQKKDSGTIADQAAPAGVKRQRKNMSRELEDLYDFQHKLIRSELGALEDKNDYLAKELKRSRGKDDLIRHQAILSEQERVKAELAEVKSALAAFNN